MNPAKQKRMQKAIQFLFAGFFFLLSFNLGAQDKGEFSIGADLVSRYIWRGTNTGGKSFHIQPEATFTYKNIELGAWGSYGLSNNFKEYDFYATYSFSNFAFTFCDYNCPTDEPGVPTTYLELGLSWEGDGKIPVYGNIYQYFYNDDGTYIDLGVKINSRHKLPMDLNLGFTPWEGSYADKTAILNVSYTISYDIPVSKEFTLPVFSSLIFNPDIEKVYFAAGISLCL